MAAARPPAELLVQKAPSRTAADVALFRHLGTRLGLCCDPFAGRAARTAGLGRLVGAELVLGLGRLWPRARDALLVRGAHKELFTVAPRPRVFNLSIML